MKAVFNGQLIEEKEAVIPISDKGYFFDFAVYSSIKVISGKIFFAKYHVDRLFESARLIDLKHQFTKKQVNDWLISLVRENQLKDALLRIILIGDPDMNKEAKLYIFPVTGLTYYPRKFYKQGVKVVTYHGERRVPNAKTKDLLLSFLAMREASRAGALEALLIDHEGNIREGTRSNFFAIKGKTLYMPSKAKTLEGITEKIIFEAVKPHFKIAERDIALADLGKYEEFFISSTLFNVMPIRQIDEMVIKTDFEKTREIERLFKEKIREL